jgi:itaconate CoA-transferase
MDAMTDNGGALKGILVVALEQAVAAPYASSRLADKGARVIKVERAEGDFARAYDHVVHGESAYFVWLNRGKESLVLDIKDANDQALLHRIVSKADVFIQNLGPGAAERAGFGAESLRVANPHLITCTISGYGDEGPYKDMKAYDLLIQAESGLSSITGSPGEPARVGVSVCDIAAGMYAENAILEALYVRERTGEGRAVSISLFDAMADWMTVPLLHFDYGGKAPAQVGLRHPSIAPYSAFSTIDGSIILIAIQNEREWARFAAQVMGHSEWAQEGPYRNNELRVTNRERLEQEISHLFSGLTKDKLVAQLKASGTAFGFANDVEGLSGHAALRRCEVASASGMIAMPASPARVQGAKSELGAIPALGQHSLEIRREFSE